VTSIATMLLPIVVIVSVMVDPECRPACPTVEIFRLRKVIHALNRCGRQPSNEIEDLAAKFLDQQFTGFHQVLVFKPLMENR
jgi:hypothetical protein